MSGRMNGRMSAQPSAAATLPSPQSAADRLHVLIGRRTELQKSKASTHY